jgi:DNA-binding NarL/FixJ family response regulator
METPQPQIRVVIAEDNADLSSALCALLEQEPDLQVTATVDRCIDLAGALRRGGAQVVVLDLNLGGESSVASMHAVRHEMPGLAVVVYSGYDRSDIGHALPKLGASEYVSKSGDAAELVAAIRRAARNNSAGTET